MSFTHAPDVHKTMCHLIQDRVAETPHIPAIAYKKENQWIDVSFQEYANRIKQIGIGLLQLEMLPGARVIVLANTSIDWAICDLGIVTAGGITVPIYPTNTESDALYIGEHSGASIAFVENHLQCKKIYSLIESGQLKKIIQFEGPIDNPDKVISLNEFREIAQRAASATTTDLYQKRMESAKPDDLISITYTSGTTGKPKGVMIHHRMMWQTLSDTYELIHDSVDTSDSLLTFLPLSHVMGKFESMTPWFFGWKCNYAQSVDKLLSNIEEVRPTLMVAVPRIFEKVYAKISDQIENGPELKKTLFKRAVEIGKTYYSYKDKDQFVPPHISIAYQLAYKLVLSKVYEKFGGRMKFFISGGAPLPAELASFLRTAKLIVLEGYGLTETCAPCATNTLHSCIIGTVGKPFPSCELKIASDGEILVKGPDRKSVV